MFRFILRLHPDAARIEVGAGSILVRGKLGRYQVRNDGAVTDGSGRTVPINFGRVGGAALWQSAIDAADLEQGRFGVNLQWLMLTVSVLAVDREFAEALG